MMEQTEQRLGNYRLIRLLGRGAFADVYLGEHLYLNTPVAIKVLRSRLDSPTLADFLIEARHISHLVHPHIIRVFDFGQEAEAPFFVMDYAPYGNLRQLHPQGTAVPLPAVVSYVKALASALQYAHDQHLIHRDLKPENVLLGTQYEVLLSDFGLALLTSDMESLQIKERFGTLAYMAPEQILGQPCPASDQYALAVMIYEWLSGQLPFQGSTALLSNQHLYAAPPSFQEKHPEIPPALEQVVFKALSKEATQRYANMLSFATAFEEVCHISTSPYTLTVLPVTTPSTPGSYQDSSRIPFRNIPVPLTPLIGRERELQKTRDMLMRPDVRLVTLAGAGGIGKTHLALALGNEVIETFADGACFVSLESINDPELVIPAIAFALGFQEKEDTCSLERLITLLRDKQLLLLLDNFEHVVTAAPILSDLLAYCPRLKLLVTSRVRMKIDGEYSFTIPPLEIPGLQHLPESEILSHIASVALFVQRVQAILPEFQLTGENAGDIATICTKLEGVPLALELAAARCQLLSPRALLWQLEHPLEVLNHGKQDAPLRHQTLRNTLKWNDNLLSPEEQTLFRRLAVFAGGCSLQAAEAISTALGDRASSVPDVILSLIDKSVLGQPAPDREEPRVYLLEMIREYGLERLAACGELEQARDAHAAYYLAFAEEADSTLSDFQPASCQKRMEDERQNFQAALEWLLASHQVEKTLRMATALEQFWLLDDHVSEGRHFLELALNASSQSNLPVSARVKAKALKVDERLALRESDQAINFSEESQQSNRKLQDRQGITATFKHTDTRTNQRNDPAVTTAQSSFSIIEHLTERETEVLSLLATGLKNSQIAERLVLSPHTVSGHVQSIFGKLGLNSRSAATRYALEHHLA